MSSEPPPQTLASIYMVCGLPKNPQCWTLAQPDYLPSHLPGAVPRFWRPEVLGTTVSGQDTNHSPSNHLQPTSPNQSTHSNPPSSSRRLPRSRTTSTSSPKTTRSPKHQLPSDSSSNHQISKDELSRIQAKAIKLAFAREVEVIASNVQPPSTTHCFSFTLPTQSLHLDDSPPRAIGQQWELVPNPSTHSKSRPTEKTYYAACLQVWSHSDRLRADAVRKTIEEGSKAKSAAVARAIQAAAAGRKFGSKLQQAFNSPMGILSLSSEVTSSNLSLRKKHSNAHSDRLLSTSTSDTEGFFSESEWETSFEPSARDNISSRLANSNPHSSPHHHHNHPLHSTIDHPAINTPLWLPHSLILISRFPLYDLLVDHLKISWARYHDSIHKHSQEMIKMLNFPVYKSTSVIKLPVGSSKESNTKFIVKLPGKNDLANAALEEVNFTMWPLFKCLSISHIISIYEIGLSPMGRIVFFSNYPAILNIAVESFRLLLELRGWVGLSQSIVHSRDFKIYLEDPGPFILGVNSQLRHIAANISPEIMVVDLDTDTIDCRKPHPTAFSKGQERAKIEKKIFHYLGSFTGPRSVPAELHEAFPGGRFRPFSAVEIEDQPSEAERLLPPPEWNWDQSKTIIVFDNIMSKLPTKGIAKLLKRKTYRQAAVLDSSALHVQEIIRKHTISFVNRRDMLETKIWKLNRRLGFLMAESMDWKQHFEQFQKFTDMLSQESQDLKTRLENERREHRTLTGVVAEQLTRQAELENRLLETEKAWMAAQVELAKAHDIREELQRQKQIMVTEMKSIALGGEDEDMLEKIVPRVESYIGTSPGHLRPKSRVLLTTKNLRRLSAQVGYSSESPDRPPTATETKSETEMDGSPSQLGSSAGHTQFPGAESDAETISDDVSGLSEIMDGDERALLSRSAVIETMRSIQSRLESALRTAGQLDDEELKPYDNTSGFAKSALSRLSTDSYDSKVIHLQRGRRKPINCLTRANSNTSKSSSPAANSNGSGKLDFSCQMESLPSNNSSGRASTVSLILPGSRIFGPRGNWGGSPADSSFNSSGATSPSDGLRAHIIDSVLNEEVEEDDDDDDDDDDRGTSFDDGASFVSANDESVSGDSRRLSSDSDLIGAYDSGPSSQQDISRVSLIGAAPFELDLPEQPKVPPSMPVKVNHRHPTELIAFPTSESHLDLGLAKDEDARGPPMGLAAKIEEREALVYDTTSASEEGHQPWLAKKRTPSNLIMHRGSNISNSSSSTIKINHSLAQRHRHPAQRHELTFPDPQRPRYPDLPPPANKLSNYFAALPTSRRLRSPNSSLGSHSVKKF